MDNLIEQINKKIFINNIKTMKMLNKHFNKIMVILTLVVIGLLIGLYMDGVNKLNNATVKLHGNHVNLNDKELLNEILNSNKLLQDKVENLSNKYDENIKKIYISLCNINSAMSLKDSTYVNNYSEIVGEKSPSKTSYESQICYKGMKV